MDSGEVDVSLESFRERLRKVSSAQKLLKVALRELQEWSGTKDVAQARYDRARDQFEHSVHSRTEVPIDEEEVRAALLRRAIPGRKTTLALAVRHDERFAQIIALRRPDRPFTGQDVKFARRVLNLVEDEIDERGASRRRSIVEKVYAQLLRRQPGNDLHYQILHAMRDLIDYDHSGAVFVYKDEVLHLQAEQIAWTKGRSRWIGRPLGLRPEEDAIFRRGNEAFLFRRDTPTAPWGWVPSGRVGDEQALPPPVPVLDFHDGEDGRPRPCVALLSALTVEERCVGFLAAFGQQPQSLTVSACNHLRPLLPLAAISIQNQLDDEGFEEAFLREQKKHAVADIARGVAHDINNSLAVLLLRSRVLREEIEKRSNIDPRLHEDIRVIEKYASSCKRIFQGMLHFARTGSTPVGPVKLQNCIRNVMEIQSSALLARHIEISMRVDESVPEVRGNQQQLERVIHNLVQNARDACKAGDRLILALRRRGGFAQLVVANSGRGIPRHVLGRVMEPFFTTRRDGHGLGLSLCRSIVADHAGTIRIQSREGTGTMVRVKIPLAESAP